MELTNEGKEEKKVTFEHIGPSSKAEITGVENPEESKENLEEREPKKIKKTEKEIQDEIKANIEYERLEKQLEEDDWKEYNRDPFESAILSSWTNITKMLLKRNYDLALPNPPVEPENAIHWLKQRGNSFIIPNEKRQPCRLFFFAEEKISISFYVQLSNPLNKDDAKHVIAFSREGISAVTMNKILVGLSHIKIEIFEYKNLYYCPVDHVSYNSVNRDLYDGHSILSDKEKEELLSKHKIKEEEIPLIQRTDVISRYYGLEPGKILKCYQITGVREKTPYYRICK